VERNASTLEEFGEMRPYLRTGLAALIYALSGISQTDGQFRQAMRIRAYIDADSFLDQLEVDLGGKK
jgi:hypothetical protein